MRRRKRYRHEQRKLKDALLTWAFVFFIVTILILPAFI